MAAGLPFNLRNEEVSAFFDTLPHPWIASGNLCSVEEYNYKHL
jgi:hypothetical protein